ncbi:MAG TPA: response regulator, partial [Roseiflexaceae bacterium]
MTRQGHILVVDDNLLNRKLLGRALEEQGYRVSLAEDGRCALDALAGAAPPIDVVLLDILMPGLDGYATLSQIKAADALRHLPVIMIT